MYKQENSYADVRRVSESAEQPVPRPMRISLSDGSIGYASA